MVWLGERHAIEGKQLQRAGDDRVWTVGEVYRRIPRSAKWVGDRRKAHERWRQVTDV
jgi:hypothetical protein